MKINLPTTIALLLVAFNALSQGGIRSVEEQGLGVGIKAKNVLINRGLCKDDLDCTRKQIIFFARQGNRIWMELYEVVDLSVVSEIGELCLAEYANSNRSLFITLEAYKSPHSDHMRLFKSMNPPPFLLLKLTPEGTP